MNAYTQYGATLNVTPQSQLIPGRETDQVANHAGGFTFAVDKWTLLDRFLILGSANPSYYADAREITKEAASAVKECLTEDFVRTVNRIVEVSDAGRAPKNDPALFALALAYCEPNARPMLDAATLKVVRTGTHLLTFVEYARSMRGWGRKLRRAIVNWFESKSNDELAYQMLKYQSRGKWAMRDLLRLRHMKPNPIYRFTVKGEYAEGAPRIIEGFLKAKEAKTENEVAALIGEYHLTREMVPTEWMNKPTVQEALLNHGMPLTALVRSLAAFTASDLIKPFSEATKLVCERIRDAEYIRKSRIHPLQVLLACATYGSGHGQKGSLTWKPVPQVIEALLAAFYASFANVEPTGKNILIGLDVSGSMGQSFQGTGMSHAMIAAAQALVIAKTEPNYLIMGFADEFRDLGITASDTLDSAIRKTAGLNFGRTDCALPMLYAHTKKLDVDCFCVISDNETYAGSIHPSQALVKYRKDQGRPKAKLAVMTTEVTGFSIADPKDAGMMDFVGFDANVPILLADFMRG